MQNQKTNQASSSITSPKPAPVTAKAKFGPWPKPEAAKLAPVTPYLSEMVSHRSQNYLGRGIPFSPLND